MLDREDTVLVLVDVQVKLSRAMHDREALIATIRTLVQGMRALDVPILWLEQNPEGLGGTVPQVAELLTGLTPIPKQSFSCCGNKPFMKALRAA